ncbi:MAG: hypothetical protein ACYC9L_05500 [Sulfuricaulis sp.]
MPLKSDNLGRNRGLHAPSVMGDPYAPEGIVPVNSLKVPQGRLLGQPTNNQSFEPIPSGTVQHQPGNHQPENLYPFYSGGSKELLGENTVEPTKDDEYPSLPNVPLTGAAGTTNAGQQADSVDFNSVAPYVYPEFPAENSDGKVTNTPVWLT